MSWKGFLKESKYYMNYSKCGKINFWTQFPFAFIKFHWSVLRDLNRRWR